MLEKADLNCVNCGAVINRRTMKCEYCGTEYKRGNDGIPIGINRNISGTQSIYAAVKVDSDLLMRHPEEGKKFAMDKLTHALAKELLKYARVTTEKDYCSFCDVIRAEVKVIAPEEYVDESEYKRLEVQNNAYRDYLRWKLGL